MIIIGAILEALQIIGIIIDLANDSFGKVIDGIAVSGSPYAISYFAAGIAGLAFIVWGMIKLKR